MRLLDRDKLAELAVKYLADYLTISPESLARLDVFRHAANNEECKLNGGGLTVPGGFIDKRGREWELFVDDCMYHMTCVRLKGDREFLSQGSFHFSTSAKAIAFASLLHEST